MDEQAIAERLIGYDTSEADGLRSAFGFVKGWLEARDIKVEDYELNGMPILACEVGAGEQRIIYHGHLDVVPGHEDQFEAQIEGDRLCGRGACDMKGAVASMMCATNELRDQNNARVSLILVPDEEGEDTSNKASDYMVDQGFVGDFAITGEPTDFHIGIAAKGVLALRIMVTGRAAHGSTPWLGDNAVLKGMNILRKIESLSFTERSSDLFERPSINLGRIIGGDAVNKVPDTCVMDLDIRFVPGEDPTEIMKEIESFENVELVKHFIRPPAHVDRDNPYVVALGEAVKPHAPYEVLSVGRDGSSDAVCFLKAGVPAVEFGPQGGGHHGPDEWVSIESLRNYKNALVDFIEKLPEKRSENEGHVEDE